jgi:hypothetical protein
VRQRAEEEFGALRGGPVGAERIAGASLLATVAALDLPALPVAHLVGPVGEPPRDAAAARRADRPPSAAVDRDECVGPERGTERVVSLAVVARIGEHPRQRHARGRAAHDGAEQRTVVGGPAGGEGGEDEVRLHVAADGELRPAARVARPAAIPVVRAAVRQLKARAVDGDRAGRRVEESARARQREGGALEGVEGPPFSSRRAA